jgi:hypothetical protein
MKTLVKMLWPFLRPFQNNINHLLKSYSNPITYVANDYGAWYMIYGTMYTYERTHTHTHIAIVFWERNLYSYMCYNKFYLHVGMDRWGLRLHFWRCTCFRGRFENYCHLNNAIPPIKVCKIFNVLWKGPCRNVGELSLNGNGFD